MISGNGGDGIQLGNDADDNVIEGNLIGVAADGTTPERQRTRWDSDDRVEGNTIGGTAAGAGNVIAYNGGSTTPGMRQWIRRRVGIAGITNSDIDNSILGNSIFDNAGLGIDRRR